MSRAAFAVHSRVLLVIFTFVLIVVLAQIALGDVLLQAWEGTGTEVGAFHTYRDTPGTVDLARLNASGEIVPHSVLEMAATE